MLAPSGKLIKGELLLGEIADAAVVVNRPPFDGAVPAHRPRFLAEGSHHAGIVDALPAHLDGVKETK